MVNRIFVEKRSDLAQEAKSLLQDLKSLLGLSTLTGLRLLNRYDVEGLDSAAFEQACQTVFSEPQTDLLSKVLPLNEDEQTALSTGDAHVFAVEYLPGQFDQRADSAAQCIQLLTQGTRPLVRSAKVYLFTGQLTSEELDKLKQYLINPVEAREASMALPECLAIPYEASRPIPYLDGFLSLNSEGLETLRRDYGLAMDQDDLLFCQRYFLEEGRDPSETELRLIDTYWSDHCRHTTFLTQLDEVRFDDPELEAVYKSYLADRQSIGAKKPVSLMDLATTAGKVLKKKGLLDHLDESDEINACTVKITVKVDGKNEDWLLLFKNETHNHPTEIEPFGGAATCIGGAIRDPLSGRSYVYAAMRVTGAADPTVPLSETMKGKLPQRKIVSTAAAGYSSYGNQIGLATGLVDELYHPGYAAKRMEIGAVIAAAPSANVRRLTPEDGDCIVLLGGATGRDGCGGATGSSKSHTLSSLESCGAEVQKGNAPEERKLQRLFRHPEASYLIKRCNDFGAGGISVAIGELADGLDIDLNAVPKKYEGLTGTELAISESQERMAVVLAPTDVKRFLELAEAENLSATVVARVTEEPVLRMHWNGQTIVELKREFLNSNGAPKHINAHVQKPTLTPSDCAEDFCSAFEALVADLNVCSKQGLSERFDSTIGRGTVLMPFGGREQRSPIQAMVHRISVERSETSTCSLMAYGYNPYLSEQSPFHGAYLAVLESISKLIATGAKFEEVYLSFQEYFERLGKDEKRWGKPLAALLGAYKAQLDYGVAAIGGKDSMSGSFEDLDVPPTLVSFAVTTDDEAHIVSPDLKGSGHRLVLVSPEYDGLLPKPESVLACFKQVHELLSSGQALAAYTPGYGGLAEALFKMAIGQPYGLNLEDSLDWKRLFQPYYGAFVLELADHCPDVGELLATSSEALKLVYQDQELDLRQLIQRYEGRLESVFPKQVQEEACPTPVVGTYEEAGTTAPAILHHKPRVLIPVFPGTNCEYDSAKAVEAAGAKAEIMVIKNLSPEAISESIERFAKALKEAQILFIPGGFSGGDEPDGSGKFITAFLRNASIKEEVHRLLQQRDGLVLGICNGFQALIKLGLLPFGEIRDCDEHCPTLTFNRIARHQSMISHTRVSSKLSPWLSLAELGATYEVPISHGEGRFIAPAEVLDELFKKGQVATQYVDLNGDVSLSLPYNPNGSLMGVEGITSPDGRVFGKMGHSERWTKGLYKNVVGQYDLRLFESAVHYFKGGKK